ncbi:hypothetical protein Lser_V15G15926 [Lactuca serriola]
MDPGSLRWPVTEPQLQLYFLLGLVYSTITPILLPFIIVFFKFAYMFIHHQLFLYHLADYIWRVMNQIQKYRKAEMHNVRARAAKFNLGCGEGEGNLLEGRDIHIHFPAGAVPKDGPSVGVTLVTYNGNQHSADQYFQNVKHNFYGHMQKSTLLFQSVVVLLQSS